jgi:hypothetical protein
MKQLNDYTNSKNDSTSNLEETDDDRWAYSLPAMSALNSFDPLPKPSL